VQFQESDFVTVTAARVTLEKPQTRIIPPHGKGIVFVIVKRTAPAFLRALAQSDLMHERRKRQRRLCFGNFGAHCTLF
jgi:hypothetical protein